MTAGSHNATANVKDLSNRLEALYRHYNDEVRWLFSNRVVEALVRIGETRLQQFLALNLPELVLNVESAASQAATFGQRAMVRWLSGREHLAKGLHVAADELNITRDAAGRVTGCHNRTLPNDQCRRVYRALCELLWQFDAAGGDSCGISSAAFRFPPRERNSESEPDRV